MTNKAISLFVLILLLILVSACESSNKQATDTDEAGRKTSKAEEQVKLVVWDWLSGDKTKGPGKHFEDIDRKYMEAHPNVTIERVAQPADKYYDILKPALLARTGPDIFLMHDNRPAEYQALVTPLNDIMPEDSKENLVGLAIFSTGNKIIAYPIGLQGNIWYYNKRLFTQAGLNPLNPPQTWEELIAIMDTLKSKGITPVAIGDKEGQYIANWSFSLNLANQLSLDEIMALSRGELKWTDARIKQAYQKSADLFLKGYTQKSALTTAIYPDNGEVFKHAEAAMTIGLLADVLNWKEFGDAIGMANLGLFINPAPADAAHTKTIFADPGIGFAINYNVKNAQAASDYLAYVTNSENSGEYYKVTGTLPNNKKTDKAIIDNALAKEIFLLATTGEHSIQAYQRITVPLQEAIVQGSQKVLFGVKSVDDFLAGVQAVAEKR